MDEVERIYAAAASRAATVPSDAAGLVAHALALAPDHGPSLLLGGILAGRAGERARCVAFLCSALRVGAPGVAETAGLRLAAALRRWGRPGGADVAYRALLARHPNSADGWFERALLLRARRSSPAALEAVQRAVSCRPGFVAALVVWAAILLEQDDLDGAESAAMRAIGLAPLDSEAVHQLASIRLAQARAGDALALCRRLPPATRSPGLLRLEGRALVEAGDPDAAALRFKQAIAASPGDREARYNLATVRKAQGRTSEAVALLGELVAADPAAAAARLGLCMATLPPIYANEHEIERRRAGYAASLADLARFGGTSGAALADVWGSAQPFLLAYQGRDDVELQRRYGEIGCRAMAARWPAIPLADPPSPGERLRVGFVCGHFRDHSVWRVPTRGWVEGLDRARFDLIGFHTGAIRDAETERAARSFTRFHQGPNRIERWRDLIVGERLHALIYPEIGMDPTVAKLAAMRLAPAQYASWGHPTTSGLPTIDFFLSSDAMEPTNGERHYSERLIRLPGLSTPLVVRPVQARPPDIPVPGIGPGDVLFWCGQNLSKYLPRYDTLLVRIALACPRARFLFVAHAGSAAVTDQLRRRLAVAFGAEGLLAGRHCLFLPPCPPAAYAALLGQADVVLDSVGWSGCNTLLDALAAGRPIVTLPGGTMRARHGAALLDALGLAGQVCGSENAYVAQAVRLAQEADLRTGITAAIWEALPKLDDGRCVEGLAEHLLRRH